MEFWKLILKEIGILKIIWESKNLNLGIEILGVKFERNWNFENYLGIGVLEIKWKLELKIKFKNWIFWKIIGKWNLGPKNSKDEKLWSQNRIFLKNQFFKSMHEDGWGKRHMNFKSGPPFMYAMQEIVPTKLIPCTTSTLNPLHVLPESTTNPFFTRWKTNATYCYLITQPPFSPP